VKDAILGGVDVLPQWDGLVATGGRLNAAKALALMGLTVSGTSPAADEVVTTRPTQFVVNLSDAYDPASVDAADLAVNGIPATSFALTDADTITFSYATSPVTAQGLQHLTVAAGAVARLSDGDGIKAYDRTFRYDALRMTVTSTVPANNAVVPVGLTTVDVNVNETIDAASVGTGDLVVSQGIVTAAVRLDADTVRFTLDGVNDEGAMSVQVPAGAFADAYGNPSVAYQGQYTVDIGTTPFPLPLNPVPPLGSMIYDPARQGQIGFAGDTDSFTMALDPGQKVTVTLAPQTWDGPGVQAKLDLYRVDSGKKVLVGSSTAAPGADAYLEVLPTSGQLGGKAKPQTYIATASGVNGTTGYYTLHVVLNAMTELESHQGGTPNDTRATAQDLNAAFVPLHSSITSTSTDPRPERAGVIGYVSGEGDYYSFALRAGESSTIAVSSQVWWTDLRVELEDAAGNRLAQGRFAQNSRQVINNFKAQAAGTYYLHVIGYSDYSLLATRNADFDTEPNYSIGTAQDLNSAAVSSKQWSHGYVEGWWETDYYRVPVAAGATLEVQTLLPVHAAGQSANNLDPMVRVYRSDGTLVARDDNSDPDGRNARVRYRVPAAGTYYVEVAASDATASPTGGEYVVSVKQGTGALPPFTVMGTDLPDGTRTRDVPTGLTVSFNDVALLPTLQASDLTIDGIPAASMTVYDGQTAHFDFPVATYQWPASAGGNGHSYLVTGGLSSWWDAEAQAVALGGHLVSINSAAENAFLQQTFFSGSHAFDVDWIGFTDNETYGGTEYGDTHDHPYPPDGDKGLGWVWTSGEPATYSNWSPFEPNNYAGDQDYGTMNLYAPSGAPGNWDDDFPWVGRLGIIELPSATGWSPTEGTHTIRIGAGAVRDVQNTPITAYSSTFSLDLTPPRVVEVSTQEGGVVGAGDVTYTVRFSEPMFRDPILYYNPFSLFGKLRGTYYGPGGVDLDPTGTVLTLNYSGLPEDAYQLTLYSGDYQFEDTAGWNLDGERPAGPIPPNRSGNGFEGGNFAVDFAADGPSVALTPSPLPPPSARVAKASASAGIVYDGDVDDFTVHLDAGQTLSVALAPIGGLLPSVVVRDPSGATIAAATAPGAGQQAVIQTVHAASAGTYTVSVGGAAHSLGFYDLQVYVNAAVEAEGRVVTPARLIDYAGGFANTSGLTANGSASFAGGVAQLTPAQNSLTGSFFANDPVDVTAFHTSFTFHLLPGSTLTADGMTFVLQNVGPYAIGSSSQGGFLGYAGIYPSVAIKFDLYDNAGEGPNSTGLFVGGTAPWGFGSVNLNGTGIDLHSGHDFRADVSYGGGTMLVTITDTATNASATQSYAIDLPANLGGNTAYVGFTGATGGRNARQEVLTWTFDGQAPQSDNTLAAAQDLDGSFSPIPGGASRGAVVGQADPAVGYDAAAVPFQFEDISATGTRILEWYYDGAQTIPSGAAGFQFQFYGNTYGDVHVNTNGLVTFDYPDWTPYNSDLSSYPYQHVIAALWDDLDTLYGGAVIWEVRGASDNQRLIIQWDNVHYAGDSDPLTFQAVLSEADGSVRLNYLDVGGSFPWASEGAGATVGVARGDGARLLLAYNNGPNAFVGSGKSTLISPLPGTPDFYSFTVSSGQHVRLELGGGGAGGTVDLLDSNGNVLASGSPGSGDVTSILSDFAPASPGRYYVRVREATGPYTLVVTRGATLP